jgi:serine/threonine protein kinase
MKIGRYRLLAQLGAGGDGVSYQAQDPQNDCLVEIRVLSAARSDMSRWQPLAKRLRLAAMLDHAAAVGIRELQLEQDLPYAVLEWVGESSLASALTEQVPLTVPRAVRMAHALAAGIAAAHRLGLVHGRLSLHTVWLAGTHGLKIDFTGIETGRQGDGTRRQGDRETRRGKTG